MLRVPVLLTALLWLPVTSPAGEPIETAFVASGVEVVGGELGSVADLLNPLLQSQFDTGGFRNLLELRDLDDPTMQDDDDISVASFPGIDVDGNPDNDFDGTNLFEVDPLGLTDTGEPLTIFAPGSITAGALLAGPADLDIGGGIVIPGAMLEGTIVSGGASMASPPIAAAIPVALFDAIPAPFPFDGFPFNYDTMTEVLSFLGVNADVDLDGDTVPDAYSVEFVLSFVSCQIIYPVLGTNFLRGDVNDDGSLDIGDGVNLLSYLFTGGTEPGCLDGADTNDDGQVNIADAVLVLSHLFTGGPPPAIPFTSCGLDPTDDLLDCLTRPGSC